MILGQFYETIPLKLDSHTTAAGVVEKSRQSISRWQDV
jgi:hypothetical protein